CEAGTCIATWRIDRLALAIGSGPTVAAHRAVVVETTIGHPGSCASSAGGTARPRATGAREAARGDAPGVAHATRAGHTARTADTASARADAAGPGRRSSARGCARTRSGTGSTDHAASAVGR